MLDYYLNSQIFVDLGEEFEVHDSNGEQPISFMISNVERVSLALSSLFFRHPLSNQCNE